MIYHGLLNSIRSEVHGFMNKS